MELFEIIILGHFVTGLVSCIVALYYDKEDITLGYVFIFLYALLLGYFIPLIYVANFMVDSRDVVIYKRKNKGINMIKGVEK